MFTSTVISQYIGLKADGELLQYRPDSASTMINLPYITALDPDGYYFTTVVYLTTLFYNILKLREAEAPTSWMI